MKREKIGWILFLIGFLIAGIHAISIPSLNQIHPVNSYFAVLFAGELLLLFGVKKARGNTFINKLKIVEEETDETIYFLELIKEVNSENSETISKLLSEANELLAIFVASIKTVRKRKK